MKLKEFVPWGGARPKFYYVDPPLEKALQMTTGGRVSIFMLGMQWIVGFARTMEG